MAKTAFLFPGQGAQTVGMGKDLHDAFPQAQKVFDQADSILDRLVHNARRLNLTGESLRKTRGQAGLTDKQPPAK